MKIRGIHFFTALVLVATSLSVKGQSFGSKVVLESGDITAIKADRNINVQFDYSQMAVGKYKTEQEYTKVKVKEYNQKESGKGDKWLAGWTSSRKERYEPKFLELINKIASDKTVFGENPKAKHTLLVKTVFIEPGYNVGVAKYPAFVNFEFTFFETANPTKIVAKLYANSVVGTQSMGFDFDTGTRVAESYAKGGKMLGKYLMD